MGRWRSATGWAVGVCLPMLVCCGGPATLVTAWLNEHVYNLKGLPEHESWTVAEARERSILVTELEAVPAELEVASGGRVRVREAWVEERARSTHRLVWLAAEERVGGYRLHLTFDNGANFVGRSARVVLREGTPESGLSGHSRGDGRELFFVELDDPDVSGVRLILARKFDDPRGKDVRFIPKPQR